MRKPIQKVYFSILLLGLILVAVAVYRTDGDHSRLELQAVPPIHMEQVSAAEQDYYFNADTMKKDGDSLVFMTNHQYIGVYADDVMIYEVAQNGGWLGHTPGSYWNFVQIPRGTEEICVRLTAAYSNVEGAEHIFYEGQELAIYKEIFKESLPALLVSIIILTIGTVMLIYGILVSQSSYTGKSLFYFGLFAIILGLWLTNETNSVTLLFEHRVAATFLAFMLLLLMPIPFILFVKEFIRIGDRKIWKILCSISLIEIVTVLVLQALDIWDMKESVILTHIMLALALAYMMGTLFYKILRRQFDKRLKVNLLGVAVLFGATVADLIFYYMGATNVDVIGKFGFLIFIIILGREAASFSLNMIEKGRKAKIYEELAVTDLLTGFLNRNAYVTDIKKIMHPEDTMIVTFDLNDLKLCNDTRGHTSGDRYLVKASQFIEKVFSRYGSCYRIGGDEFCVVIQNASRCQIEELMEKLVREQQKYNIAGHDVPIRIACGYAMYDKSKDRDIEATRDRADIMMYCNKRQLKQQERMNEEKIKMEEMHAEYRKQEQ